LDIQLISQLNSKFDARKSHAKKKRNFGWAQTGRLSLQESFRNGSLTFSRGASIKTLPIVTEKKMGTALAKFAALLGEFCELGLSNTLPGRIHERATI